MPVSRDTYEELRKLVESSHNADDPRVVNFKLSLEILVDEVSEQPDF